MSRTGTPTGWRMTLGRGSLPTPTVAAPVRSSGNPSGPGSPLLCRVPARPPESTSPPAGGYQPSRAGASAAANGALPELKNRHVRSRLLLLVVIPAVAVTVIAFCVGGLTHVLQGSRINSPSSSTHNGAILSALLIGVVMIVVLVLAAWLTIVTARSVLRPLYRLRVKALETVSGRRPDATRRSGNDGENPPSDAESVDVDSTEI